MNSDQQISEVDTLLQQLEIMHMELESRNKYRDPEFVSQTVQTIQPGITFEEALKSSPDLDACFDWATLLVEWREAMLQGVGQYLGEQDGQIYIVDDHALEVFAKKLRFLHEKDLLNFINFMYLDPQDLKKIYDAGSFTGANQDLLKRTPHKIVLANGERTVKITIGAGQNSSPVYNISAGSLKAGLDKPGILHLNGVLRDGLFGPGTGVTHSRSASLTPPRCTATTGKELGKKLRPLAAAAWGQVAKDDLSPTVAEGLRSVQ